MKIDLLLLAQTTDENLTKTFPGVPRAELRRLRESARKEFPAEARIAADRAQSRSRAKEKDTARLYKAALARIEELEKQIGAIDSFPAPDAKDMRVAKKSAHREALPVIQASDWHAAELVTREMTNGLNEYNLKVFDRRSKAFFANTAKLVQHESRGVEIPEILLHIGGDMISSDLHEDLMASNQLGPMDELALAQDTIVGGVEQLLEDLQGVKIRLVFSPGNHSRTTKKPRVSTRAATNLEWLMSHSIAGHFAKDPRVICVRERSYHTYIDAYGFALRFHHGDSIRYKDGVGGITIPVAKKIAQWNKGRQAYCDFFGHWHTRFAGQDFSVNGSLIGYNAFAIQIGASFQKPVQSFTLIDSKEGRTIQAPIFVG